MPSGLLGCGHNGNVPRMAGSANGLGNPKAFHCSTYGSQKFDARAVVC